MIFTIHMSKNRIVLAIGIILMLIPFLGFTTSQIKLFCFVFGVVLFSLSFSHSVRVRSIGGDRRKNTKNKASSVFVDGHGSITKEVPSTPGPTSDFFSPNNPVTDEN